MAYIACHSCGKTKECEFVKDPFVDEVFPEDSNEPKWWCEDCLTERCDDV